MLKNIWIFLKKKQYLLSYITLDLSLGFFRQLMLITTYTTYNCRENLWQTVSSIPKVLYTSSYQNCELIESCLKSPFKNNESLAYDQTTLNEFFSGVDMARLNM